MSNELTGYCDLHGEHTFPESLACQKCQRAHERHLVSEHIDANQRLEAENAELRRAISEAHAEIAVLTSGFPCHDGCCLPDEYSKAALEWVNNFHRYKADAAYALEMRELLIKIRCHADASSGWPQLIDAVLAKNPTPDPH